MNEDELNEIEKEMQQLRNEMFKASYEELTKEIVHRLSILTEKLITCIRHNVLYK